MTDTDDKRTPRRREHIVGREEVEAQLREMLETGALANGWLITGPRGSGKATLAYRLARAILDSAALVTETTLDMPASARVFRLAAQGAHPDLFVAERAYDEKTQRYQSEITVDRVRELSSFLGKTASTGGWRVAIIDSADDMNRQAANALLKSLEEPPAKTAMLLLSNAPGRLLATIRSRCRRIDLQPVPEEAIASLLRDEAQMDAASADKLARASGGRPGYALTLAEADGAEAVAAAENFIVSAMERGEAGAFAAPLLGRGGSSKWEIFTTVLLDRIAASARAAASDEDGDFGDATAGAIVSAYEQIKLLVDREDAVNLDRAQVLGAMARALQQARRGA